MKYTCFVIHFKFGTEGLDPVMKYASSARDAIILALAHRIENGLH